MMHSDYILFIDEDPISEELQEYFAGFKIDVQENTSLNVLNNLQKTPIAILISWTLVQNNLSIIRNTYQRYAVPLLIMHKVMDENICIQVLEAGADDFTLKPLPPRELHARISAINRRILRSDHQKSTQDKVAYQFANWFLYPFSRQVFDAEHQELLLSSGEYDLLFAFVQKPQQILSRDQLSRVTKNTNLNPLDRRIDVQISRLRQKIENDAKNAGIIKTIRNGGYMFTASVEIMKS